MNIKKKLQEERKRIDEQILAEGQELRDSLIAQYCVSETTAKPSVKKKNYIKWIASVSCVIVVCLVIGLGVGLTRPKTPEYFYRNEVEINYTIEELYFDTMSTVLINDSFSISKVVSIDDRISSDNLYYRIEFEHLSDFVSGELNVVVNKYYKFNENHIGSVQKSKFNKYDMEYSVRETTIEDIPMNEYFGRINYNGYKIYFSFTELRLDDTKSPNAVLNELLILK